MPLLKVTGLKSFHVLGEDSRQFIVCLRWGCKAYVVCIDILLACGEWEVCRVDVEKGWCELECERPLLMIAGMIAN